MSGANEVRWARRVPQPTIRRLYALDARGIVDEELIDEVGYAFYARCESIRRATEAHAGRVTCPGCRAVVLRTSHSKDEAIVCACGWETTWGEYHRSFQRKQLHGGAAYGSFLEFLERWPATRSPRDKLLLIDRLVHALHVNAIEQKELLFARSAAVNLIEGKLREVNDLLEALAYGAGTAPELHATREAWRDTRARASETMARRFGRRRRA